MFLLGMLFVGLELVTDSLYALLAGGVGNWLQAHRGLGRSARYLAGAAYMVLGLAAVGSEAP
jgi:threonine/homoserine/homoserine lactone efflux protein